MNFAFLENFQKSLGGLVIATRQLMQLEWFLGSWRWNRLSAQPWPSGDTCLSPSFLGFLWTTWRWWTPARRRKPILVRFWCFGFLGWFWSGKKEVLSNCEWLEVLHCWITCGWRFNLIKLLWITFWGWTFESFYDLSIIIANWYWNCAGYS